MVTGQAMVAMETIEKLCDLSARRFVVTVGHQNTDLVSLEKLTDDSVFSTIMIDTPR